MTDTPTTIRIDRDGPVATVWMNRPEHRNAIGGAMLAELHSALQGIAIDRSVRILVLRGAGGDFCPGADIKHYGSGNATQETPAPDLTLFDIPVLLHEMPALTIAAVQGACAGAGMGWACACDLRVASETARFNSAFLDVGVAGDMGGPWTLPRIVGPARARELYFLPGKFDAAEARQIGLVSRVSAAAEFEADLQALVERLRRAAPMALTEMKANFLAAEKVGFGDYIALESEKHLRLFQSEDTAEAFRAFLEKREPQFRGR